MFEMTGGQQFSAWKKRTYRNIGNTVNMTDFLVEHFLTTYLIFFTLTPHDLNSMTFVLGSSVDPGGAPPGPLSSGFRLPPEI